MYIIQIYTLKWAKPKNFSLLLLVLIVLLIPLAENLYAEKKGIPPVFKNEQPNSNDEVKQNPRVTSQNRTQSNLPSFDFFRAYPWNVGLGIKSFPGDLGVFCGGVLIDSNWVLTTAHCLADNVGDIEVLYGSLYLSSASSALTI